MKKFDLTTPIYDASKFTWQGNIGCAELSDFKDNDHFATRCYSDSTTDQGCILYNPKTDRSVEFIRTGFTRDPEDGTLLFCTFRSICNQFQLTIFND